jgi:putative nucleotidyltransferase with HDIG domain
MISIYTKEQSLNKADEFTEHKSIVEALVTAIDAKDPYSVGHSRRVRNYALMAAKMLGIPSDELQIIEFGALLHDVGKIMIPDSILRKREPLTTEELYIIRKHSHRGAGIVSEIPCLARVTDLVLCHHERYDGKGYPRGLKSEQIPIGADLIAVADAFDTMTVDQSYRPALSVKQAITELRNGARKQFHPAAVDALIQVGHIVAVDIIISKIDHRESKVANLIDNR